MLKYIVIGILISVVVKLVKDFQVFVKFSEYSTFHDCAYLNVDMEAPEDLVEYKNYIITGSGIIDILYRDPQQPIHSKAYRIKGRDALELQIIGFPQDVALVFHGLAIYQDYLYVINHAFQFGGERVEVFKINDEITSLTYVKSYQIDDSMMGSSNDIEVLSENRFLLTKSNPFESSKQGRKHDGILHQIKSILVIIAKLKYTYVYDCHVTENLKCNILEDSYSVIANGIALDADSHLYVADSGNNLIRQFNITDRGIKLEKVIPLKGSPDNLHYDHKSNSIIITSLAKQASALDLQNFITTQRFTRNTNFEYWSQVSQYNISSGELVELAQSTTLSKGSSTVIFDESYTYIGSWVDVSVMVCQRHK